MVKVSHPSTTSHLTPLNSFAIVSLVCSPLGNSFLAFGRGNPSVPYSEADYSPSGFLIAATGIVWGGIPITHLPRTPEIFISISPPLISTSPSNSVPTSAKPLAWKTNAHGVLNAVAIRSSLPGPPLRMVLQRRNLTSLAKVLENSHVNWPLMVALGQLTSIPPKLNSCTEVARPFNVPGSAGEDVRPSLLALNTRPARAGATATANVHVVRASPKIGRAHV